MCQSIFVIQNKIARTPFTIRASSGLGQQVLAFQNRALAEGFVCLLKSSFKEESGLIRPKIPVEVLEISVVRIPQGIAVISI